MRRNTQKGTIEISGHIVEVEVVVLMIIAINTNYLTALKISLQFYLET